VDVAWQLGFVSLLRGAKIAGIFLPCVCHHSSVSFGEPW